MALTDNLISFWELEEASGTRNDSHGTNHLTDNNTVLSGTGKVGTAADFDRTASERLSIVSNSTLQSDTTSMTVCLWANLETKANFMMLAGKFDASAEWAIEYRTDADRFRFGTWGAEGFAQEVLVVANNLGAVSTATWYFVVCWYDRVADIVGIQINDGTANTAARTTDLWVSTREFVIGGETAFGSYTDGLIDQVGYWKRVLTTDEKTFLYNNGDGKTYAQIVAEGGGGSLMGQIIL